MTNTWQSEAETNRIPQYGIALGAEKTKPDVSTISLGGGIEWNSLWTAISVYFTDDDIAVEPVEEDGIEINPPTAPGIIALIRDKVGIRRINFTSYEVGAKLLQYATNIAEVHATTGVVTPGSGYWIETQTHTRTAVAIEFVGLGILWLPSCEIKALPPTGNVKKPATQEVVIDVFCVNVGNKDITYAWLEYKA